MRKSAMRVSLLCSVASVFLASAAFAQGEGEFPATLRGHAVLPAQSFIDAPADAPDDLKTAGKYTTGKRVDNVGGVMGKSYERPTGVSLPFKGQPLQGHSGIKVMPDGSFWVLTDNGMGSRYNSADSMLYLNRHKIDWASGKIDRQETIFLHDPTRKCRSASCMRTRQNVISPAPISTPKAFRSSATLSGSATSSAPTS
jgi:hypothetical protein